jgi:hypothetical protein
MFAWRKVGQEVARAEEREGDASEQSSRGLARVLSRLPERDSPAELLDLGSRCGPTAVYLASRGARVRVEPFEPPADLASWTGIAHEDGRFDVVLAWDVCDFVPPEQLPRFILELERVLAPKGWLLLFAQDNPSRSGPWPESPWSYEVTADDRFMRRPTPEPPRSRWCHPNRRIQQALTTLAIQENNLQRNRLREFLVQKKTKPS